MLTLSKNKKILIGIAVFSLLVVLAAVLLMPKVKENRLQKNLDLGMQYLNELDYETAILYFRDVLQIDPMNEEAKEALVRTYRSYGDLLSEQGNPEKAAELYRLLIELADTAENQVLLAKTYTAMGLYRDAADIYRRLTEFEPDNVTYWHDYAHVCENTNDTAGFAEAEKTLAEILHAVEGTLYTHSVSKSPTCAEEGLALYTCAVCEIKKTENIPVTENHVWDEGTMTEKPDKSYVLLRTCTVCGKTKEEPVEVVVFDDPVLEQAIRDALGIPTGGITVTEAEMLKKLSYNGADGEKITSIQALQYFSGLEKLSLVNHAFGDISPLKGLTNLTYLSISNDDISDIRPLEELTGLTYLSLVGNRLSDISPLRGLTRLSTLYLSNNKQISDVGPLKGLTALTDLSLEDNQISDISPLEGLTELTRLRLRFNRISDIRPLRGLTKLESLDIEYNSVTDCSPVKALPNLTDFTHD